MKGYFVLSRQFACVHRYIFTIVVGRRYGKSDDHRVLEQLWLFETCLAGNTGFRRSIFFSQASAFAFVFIILYKSRRFFQKVLVAVENYDIRFDIASHAVCFCLLAGASLLCLPQLSHAS